jgi:hypothetical protein
VLVFRDQHKEEVQNYAIIGETLWTFAPQHTQRIPLSALDIPATEKANDERGVTFRIPGSGEGQYRFQLAEFASSSTDKVFRCAASSIPVKAAQYNSKQNSIPVTRLY